MLCDLNVQWPTSAVNMQAAIDAARRAAADLVSHGYHVVAFNQTVRGKLGANLASAIQLADPAEWAGDAHLVMTAQGRGNVAIRQLKRLTVVLDDPSQLPSLNSTNAHLQEYDLFAVTPTNEKTWMAACQQVDCDIISLDLAQRLPFYFKHSLVGEAVRRGIVFEICYSGAFKDSTAKRNLIANASNLLRVSKGKNVILSSGAKSVLETRGPLDVVNLACLLGANQDAAKHSISTYCRAAILHGETRRATYRAAAAVDSIAETPAADVAWKFGQDLGGSTDFVGFGDSDDDEDAGDDDEPMSLR
ncbi:RNA-binding RNA processing protein rpp1 [Blastocladiella emersonii ATCC 22665]|nr:RNA-binding RNA processing protein rpp1 [Blastocladiella emersonii ATCC 22665]